MPEHDAQPALAHRLSALDKRPLFQRNRLRPHQPRVARPGSQTDNNHNVDDVAAKQRNDDQRQKERRRHQKEVDELGNNPVYLAAEETGDRADARSDQTGDAGGDNADHQRSPRTVDNLTQYVAAQSVRTQKMTRGSRRLDQRVIQLLRITWRQYRRKDRYQQQNNQQDNSRSQLGVLFQNTQNRVN